MRVGDVAITFFEKRVEAPFYEPRGAAGLIKAHTQRPGGLGKFPRRWLRVKRNHLDTFHNVMERDCPWGFHFPRPKGA